LLDTAAAFDHQMYRRRAMKTASVAVTEATSTYVETGRDI
jgi:hypothetical protein